MDASFEGSFIKDCQWSREAFLAVKMKFIILMSVLVLAYQAIAVYIIAGRAGKTVAVIACDALVLLLCSYVIVKSIRVPIKLDVAKFGKPISVRVCATEEKLISYKSSGDIVELDYARVKRMKQSKNYLYLISNTGIWYCVSKNGFNVGDYGSFLGFLSDKGLEI